jgi:hypothetical protein
VWSTSTSKENNVSTLLKRLFGFFSVKPYSGPYKGYCSYDCGNGCPCGYDDGEPDPFVGREIHIYLGEGEGYKIWPETDTVCCDGGGIGSESSIMADYGYGEYDTQLPF